MSRLTKKINRNYEISANYEEISSEYVITQKLGELEDIEEKYNIDSVEELDVLLGCAIKNEEKIIELSADLGTYQSTIFDFI